LEAGYSGDQIYTIQIQEGVLHLGDSANRSLLALTPSFVSQQVVYQAGIRIAPWSKIHPDNASSLLSPGAARALAEAHVFDETGQIRDPLEATAACASSNLAFTTEMKPEPTILQGAKPLTAWSNVTSSTAENLLGRRAALALTQAEVFGKEGAIDDLHAAIRALESVVPLVATEKYKTQVYAAGGIFPAIIGTLLLVAGSICIALFLGVLSAVYLSEYSSQSRLIHVIRLSIMNLAGVPSIVFGMFGYAFFVILFGWNVSLMAGWFTLAFMVLPVIITASEESLRAVPQGFREGSLALGATKWQTIRQNVLPYAMPGILTSSVLAISRVAGETAPIMFTAAFVVRDELPWQVQRWTDFFFNGVMALPYHIFVVSARVPQNEYTSKVQYATAFVFLALVLLIALTSILLRIKVRSKHQW